MSSHILGYNGGFCMFLVNMMMRQVPSLKYYLNHIWQNQELLSGHHAKVPRGV